MLDDVRDKNQTLVITKHGEPVAKVVPVPKSEASAHPLEGSIAFQKDLIGPIDTGWEATQ